MISDSAVDGVLRFLGSAPQQDIRQVPVEIALSLVQTCGSLHRVSGRGFPSAVLNDWRSE